MFAKRLKAERIPPTFDALELHLRKAIYQGMGPSSPHTASFTFTNRMGMDQR